MDLGHKAPGYLGCTYEINMLMGVKQLEMEIVHIFVSGLRFLVEFMIHCQLKNKFIIQKIVL